MRSRMTLAWIIVLWMAVSVHAEITIPGVAPEAHGSDGALNFTGNQYPLIDLSKARSGDGITWASPGGDFDNDQRGDGVYDPEKWAVVYKYSSVNLNMNGGYYLYFKNHPSGAPVVWLVWGDVTINYLNLNGNDQNGVTSFSVPGAGGFRGARGVNATTPGSGGFGPGGGQYQLGVGNSGASHGTQGGVYLLQTAAPVYGNSFSIPLIGGSGGAAWGSVGGGAGGGAITIVATGTITINSNGIVANGGSGHGNGSSGGSGGAIRLIADRVQGPGPLTAAGGGGYRSGGSGRIFVQANENTLTRESNPPMLRTNFSDSPFYIWAPEPGDPVPPEHIAPKVWPVKLVANGGDIPFPDDPRASLDFQLTDVAFDTTNSVDLHVSASNMPTNWTVLARVVLKAGDDFTTAPAVLASGDQTASNWVISGINLPRGIGAIQVRAFKPAQP